MKPTILAITLSITVSLAACTTPPAAPAFTAAVPKEEAATGANTVSNADAANHADTVNAAGAEVEVRELVERFGKRLQMVSLLAPGAAQDLQKQYSEFVSRSLLETWMNDVSRAPGRMVSSPWPDRIEITTLVREAPNRYVMDGFIVEITSTELASGGAANRIPVHIVVGQEQGRWLITEYTEQH